METNIHRISDKIPTVNLGYLIKGSFRVITKLIRRYRLRKIFKQEDMLKLWQWFIHSYNSCIFSSLTDDKLFDFVMSGILVIESNGNDNYSTDIQRRIRMNPNLFKLIIF